MNKILVIDDDITINELVKINLELRGFNVISAENGADGFALVKQEQPDLIILDVMMPEIDGFTVAKRIRENASTSETPILMLTALSQLTDKVKGFDIGVDDYLVKPFEIEELFVRVRALLKRTNLIPKSLGAKDILNVGDITLIPEEYKVKIKEESTILTSIEFEILNLLVQNYGTMVSPKKILTDVWGYDEDDDIVETIRVHIKHIRSKIEKISNGKKYIKTTYRGGYTLYPNGVDS